MPSDTSAPQECHDKNEKDQDNHHTSEERTRGLFDKNEKDQYNEKDQWDEKTKVRGDIKTQKCITQAHRHRHT